MWNVSNFAKGIQTEFHNSIVNYQILISQCCLIKWVALMNGSSVKQEITTLIRLFRTNGDKWRRQRVSTTRGLPLGDVEPKLLFDTVFLVYLELTLFSSRTKVSSCFIFAGWCFLQNNFNSELNTNYIIKYIHLLLPRTITYN